MRLTCDISLIIYNVVRTFLFIFLIFIILILIQLKMTKLCRNVLVYYCIVNLLTINIYI